MIGKKEEGGNQSSRENKLWKPDQQYTNNVAVKALNSIKQKSSTSVNQIHFFFVNQILIGEEKSGKIFSQKTGKGVCGEKILHLNSVKKEPQAGEEEVSLGDYNQVKIEFLEDQVGKLEPNQNITKIHEKTLKTV